MKYIVSLVAIAMMFTSVGPVSASVDVDPGDLVKCPDFSAVYYIGQLNDRWSFPNENIYFSWYNDFDDVKTISCSQLSDYQLAGSVMYQSGTRLVKMPSVNTVYYAEPFGILKAIDDEEQATNMYGANWADQVDDLSEAFFPAYELSYSLSDTRLPNGMMLKDSVGNLYRTNAEHDVILMTGLLTGDQTELMQRHATTLGHSSYDFDLIIAHMRTDANLEELEWQSTPVWYTYTNSRLATLSQFGEGLIEYADLLEWAVDYVQEDDDNYELMAEAMMNTIEGITDEDIAEYYVLLEGYEMFVRFLGEFILAHEELEHIEIYEEVNGIVTDVATSIETGWTTTSLTTMEEWNEFITLLERIVEDTQNGYEQLSDLIE